MNPALRIIFDIWACEREWDRLLEPSMTGFTVNNYHRWPLEKLEYVVSIQDREKKLRRELRKLIGRWNYFRFLMSPARFAESLQSCKV